MFWDSALVKLSNDKKKAFFFLSGLFFPPPFELDLDLVVTILKRALRTKLWEQENFTAWSMNHDPFLKLRRILRYLGRRRSTLWNPHMEITTNDTPEGKLFGGHYLPQDSVYRQGQDGYDSCCRQHGINLCMRESRLFRKSRHPRHFWVKVGKYVVWKVLGVLNPFLLFATLYFLSWHSQRAKFKMATTD